MVCVKPLLDDMAYRSFADPLSLDLRFPTSLDQAGSDVMNVDADYSAAYYCFANQHGTYRTRLLVYDWSGQRAMLRSRTSYSRQLSWYIAGRLDGQYGQDLARTCQ